MSPLQQSALAALIALGAVMCPNSIQAQSGGANRFISSAQFITIHVNPSPTVQSVFGFVDLKKQAVYRCSATWDQATSSAGDGATDIPPKLTAGLCEKRKFPQPPGVLAGSQATTLHYDGESKGANALYTPLTWWSITDEDEPRVFLCAANPSLAWNPNTGHKHSVGACMAVIVQS